MVEHRELLSEQIRIIEHRQKHPFWYAFIPVLNRRRGWLPQMIYAFKTIKVQLCLYEIIEGTYYNHDTESDMKYLRFYAECQQAHVTVCMRTVESVSRTFVYLSWFHRCINVLVRPGAPFINNECL